MENINSSPSQEDIVNSSPSQEDIVNSSPSQEDIVNSSPSQEDRLKYGLDFFTPWFLILTSTIVLCFIAWFLYDNIFWLRSHSVTKYDSNNLSYRSHIYFLYISSVRRSVGLFSGIALMFLGVGVSFYTIKSQTKLNINSANVSAGVVTASPGIIAMLLGAFLVAHNTSSKDEIPIYSDKRPPILEEKIFKNKGDANENTSKYTK